MKNILKSVILIVSISIFISGCSSKEKASKTITHIDGTKLEVPTEVDKIGAIYGPTYEALVALGQEDKIVVCSDVQFQNFPWATKIFPRISEVPFVSNVHSSVNVEQVMTYSPDIVFAFPRPNELKQFKKVNIPTVNGVTTKTLNNTKDLLMVYAEALGDEAIEKAKKYQEYFDKKVKMIKDITEHIEQDQRPKVYYAGMDMLTTYGMYSDISELIDVAGGQSVSSDLEAGNRVQINFEQLAEWNPDYIFIDHGGINERNTVEEILDTTYSNKRYQAIKAVRDKQIYLSPSGVFYWDMGLQKILLLMYIAKTIHPDKFMDLNMEEEIMYFYEQFFDYKLTEKEAKKILLRESP